MKFRGKYRNRTICINQVIFLISVLRDELNQQRRLLRKNSDLDFIPEDVFIKHYRLPKVLARELVDMLGPMLAEGQRNSKISVELKVGIHLEK